MSRPKTTAFSALKNLLPCVVVVSCVVLASISQQASAIVIPDDPRQSIVFWKPHIISSENTNVARVEQIFSVLLRTWNNSRIAPSIHVVKSTTGPWAASLADGNILISMDAVKICLSFGQARSQHLLAFVLAHELAHQRSDDLWHQKFFRLIGNQSAAKQKQMLRGIDQQWLNDVEKKEAQADHDGLVMMSSVGYDPYQIINDNDFFTTWVEQLWKSSCAKISSTHPAKAACLKAETRSLRAQAQLETTATQTTIYELALQAFVAGDLVGARNLFKVYGREHPSRAVYSSIGLTYLSEAITLKNDPSYVRASGSIPFYYPILLDTQASANVAGAKEIGTKRGDAQLLKRQSKKIRQLIEDASHYFERAIKLAPDNQHPYLLLSFAYLVDNNTFMARGILQGKYKPRFGNSAALDFIVAMTSAIEGNISDSIKTMKSLIRSPEKYSYDTGLPKALLRYAIHYNLAKLYARKNMPNEQKKLWQSLAQESKRSGETLLFRMALSKLNTQPLPANYLAQHPQILSHRPGDRFEISETNAGHSSSKIINSELWIEGEKHLLYRIPEGGIRIIVNAQNKKIVNAWQEWSTGASIARLTVGDSPQRAHKIFGIPDREIFFTRGTYLAYDNFGFGIHIVNNKVVGWFLYDKHPT